MNKQSGFKDGGALDAGIPTDNVVELDFNVIQPNVKELAQIHFRRKNYLECLRMINVPNDPKEAEKRYVEYRLAEAAEAKALRELKAAIDAS